MKNTQGDRSYLRKAPWRLMRVGLFAVALVSVVAVFTAQARAATVTSDKADYSPGETVIISGSGWQPGETVVFLLQEDPDVCGDWQIYPPIADENGNFTIEGFDDSTGKARSKQY